MEYAQVEVFLARKMPHTRHKRLPERAVIRPFGKDFVDSGVVDGRFAVGVLWYGQALPLHPRVELPEDEVKDAIIAQFALRSPLGHREVGQEKCLELWFGELDRNRRRCKLWGSSAHHVMLVFYHFEWHSAVDSGDAKVVCENQLSYHQTRPPTQC